MNIPALRKGIYWYMLNGAYVHWKLINIYNSILHAELFKIFVIILCDIIGLENFLLSFSQS